VGSEKVLDTIPKVIFTTSLSNAGLFHGMLYAASAHSEVLQGVPSSALSIFYEVQTLRLINEELSRPETNLSDTLIVAILFLANFEVSIRQLCYPPLRSPLKRPFCRLLTFLQNMNGNLRAAQAHMQGLRHIVKLRGGLKYLGLNGRLANLLLL
jgi:hypothetical protein